MAAGSELTIYIVEDSPAVMERLMEAVCDIPNAKVVGSADAVAAAIEGMRISQPRVLILDIQLRGGSGAGSGSDMSLRRRMGAANVTVGPRGSDGASLSRCYDPAAIGEDA